MHGLCGGWEGKGRMVQGGASRIWRNRSNRKGTCMEAAWLVGNQVTLTNSILENLTLFRFC